MAQNGPPLPTPNNGNVNGTPLGALPEHAYQTPQGVAGAIVPATKKAPNPTGVKKGK